MHADDGTRARSSHRTLRMCRAHDAPDGLRLVEKKSRTGECFDTGYFRMAPACLVTLFLLSLSLSLSLPPRSLSSSRFPSVRSIRIHARVGRVPPLPPFHTCVPRATTGYSSSARFLELGRVRVSRSKRATRRIRIENENTLSDGPPLVPARAATAHYRGKRARCCSAVAVIVSVVAIAVAALVSGTLVVGAVTECVIVLSVLSRAISRTSVLPRGARNGPSYAQSHDTGLTHTVGREPPTTERTAERRLSGAAFATQRATLSGHPRRPRDWSSDRPLTVTTLPSWHVITAFRSASRPARAIGPFPRERSLQPSATRLRRRDRVNVNVSN